jgi:hypothetical protein
MREYHPRKRFLKQLKGFFDEVWAHDKRNNARWAGAESFLLKLADNDPAYYERLLAIIYGLGAVKFKYSKLDMAIIKGYYNLPVSVGDFKK